MDDVRLSHLGQQNQTRSPPKWHGVLVSSTVFLIGSNPECLAFLYAIVIRCLVTTSETELKTMPFLDQVQPPVPPNRASVFMCVILNSQPASSSTVSNFAHPHVRPASLDSGRCEGSRRINRTVPRTHRSCGR